MFFEDDEKEYKSVAPDIDALIRYFDNNELFNRTKSTPKLLAAVKPIFDILKPLAPIKSNKDTKVIWIRIPRGNIEDYDSFEGLKGHGEVATYEEFEKLWKTYYPSEYKHETKWFDKITRLPEEPAMIET